MFRPMRKVPGSGKVSLALATAKQILTVGIRFLTVGKCFEPVCRWIKKRTFSAAGQVLGRANERRRGHGRYGVYVRHEARARGRRTAGVPGWATSSEKLDGMMDVLGVGRRRGGGRMYWRDRKLGYTL